MFALQECSWEKDESSESSLNSSLDFIMLLSLESLFPSSLSPPLAGGNRAVLLGVFLLIFYFCDLPVFQTHVVFRILVVFKL